ncbi:MAG TPA: Hsp20/alpha crystallin family protein [Pirellulales bacterium]|jgi:HSP20 family protein
MTTETTLQKEAHESDVETTRNGQVYRPHVDILEMPDELVVVTDLPGAHGSEVDIQFDDGELSVRAPVQERQANGVRYLLREFGVGEFYRTFRVSEQIDASRIAAEFANGVLTLHLPKVAAVKPRKITVSG